MDAARNSGSTPVNLLDVSKVPIPAVNLETDTFLASSGASSVRSGKGGADEVADMELARKIVAEEENKSAHDMYLGAELATSLRSLSVASLGPLSDEEGDCLSDASSSASPRGTPATTSIESGGGGEAEVDYSQLDRYGFIVVTGQRERTPPGQTVEERELRRKQERRGRKEARRAIKWVEMLKQMESKEERIEWLHTVRKFESRLVKGIPECLRTKIWAMFLGVGLGIKSPPAVAGSPTLALGSNSYRELYLKISGFERQIDLDIERTLRDHILFKARFSSAQVSLFKILVAYSNFDTEVGYCQGMSTIAAFLLLYFEEEQAFAVLQALMTREGLRTMFTAGFPLLFETFFVQEQLMRKYMPALQQRLESFHITSSVYATKWYLTLFLGFPFALATRLWDLFLFWGLDMLVCVSLALLKLHEGRLLTLEYEAAMQFLSKLPEMPIDDGRLVRLTWRIWRRIYPHYNDPAQRERKNPFTALRLQYGKLHVNERRKHH